MIQTLKLLLPQLQSDAQNESCSEASRRNALLSDPAKNAIETCFGPSDLFCTIIPLTS